LKTTIDDPLNPNLKKVCRLGKEHQKGNALKKKKRKSSRIYYPEGYPPRKSAEEIPAEKRKWRLRISQSHR